MANTLQTVLDAWRRMGLVQRVMAISVVLACAGAAFLLLDWAREPQMALLYSGLDPKDASEVVSKIQDAGVPYDLKDGGTSVYVPVEKVGSLRIDLAGDSLPTGGREGWGIIDSEKIGASPFTQQINYLRALEGELAKTIEVFDAVAGARVHVVRTEGRLFQKEAGSASATVAVRVRPGRNLSQGNVASIVHLVAGSVRGVDPEHVVVVDSKGALLSTGQGGGYAGSGGTVLDYKSQVEQYLARKAEEMLTLVLGPGRATVKVDAKIETSTVNKTEERYNPDGKVASKEETTSKSEKPAPTEGGATGGESKEETITTEYEVGRSVEQTINMPGKITSLSVAAFVDLSAPEPEAPAEAEGGEAPAEPTAPSGPDLTEKDLEEVIRRAIGVSEADELKVVSCAFRRPSAVAEEAEADFLSDPAFYLAAAKHASVGILVIGALLALKMLGGPGRKGRAAALGEGGSAEGALAGGQGAEFAGNLLTAGGAGAAPPANAAELNRRIAAALQDNPDEVKRLFRTWAQQQQGAA